MCWHGHARSLSEDDPILIEAMAARVLALIFLTHLPEALELSREWHDVARTPLRRGP